MNIWYIRTLANMFYLYIHLLLLSQWNADKSVPQSQKGTSPVSGTGLPVMTVALYVHSSTAVWCQHQRRGVGGVDSLGYDGSCVETHYIVPPRGNYVQGY